MPNTAETVELLARELERRRILQAAEEASSLEELKQYIQTLLDDEAK